MPPKNHKYCLCRYFRVKYLVSLFILKLLFSGKKITIYYLISANISDFFGRKNKLISKIFFNRINITPFPYNLTEIYISDNRAIFDAAHFDSMDQIVDEIESTVLNSKNSIINHLNKKLSLVRNEFRLLVKQLITMEFYDDVMLLETAAWLSAHPSSKIRGSNVTAIVDKVSCWSKFFLGQAKKKKVDVLFFRSGTKNLRKNIVIIYLYNLIKICVSVKKSKQKDSLSGLANPKGKISVCHSSMGNLTDYDKRNYYLFWYPFSGIDPDRIMIFTSNSQAIDRSEINKIHGAGFNILSCNVFSKENSELILPHKTSFAALKIYIKYSVEMVRLLVKVRSILGYKEWTIVAKILAMLPYWEDFFVSNNVKICFKQGGIPSCLDLALKLSKGVIVSYHYSNRDRFELFHHDCSDIYFVWGRKYVDIFKNRHSIVKNIIQSGYVFDYSFELVKEKAWKLQKNLRHKNAEFIIAIFDETMTKVPYAIGESMRKNYLNLYRALFEYTIENQGVGLIIKPKKAITKTILESSEVTSRIFLLLIKKGKVVVLDHNKLPIEAGKASDITVGMLAESTSALECSLAGIPSVVFNGTGQKDSNTDYNWGKNKVIFDDIGTMIKSIDRYKKNPEKENGFGDWSPVIYEKDPFQDGRARDRIGCYMKVLLENINKGMGKTRAIELANEKYKKKYGHDKVTYDPSLSNGL